MFLDYLVAFKAIGYVYIISFLPKHIRGDYIIKAAVETQQIEQKRSLLLIPAACIRQVH